MECEGADFSEGGAGLSAPVSGMMLACMPVFCNFPDSTTVIIALMSLAPFGKSLAQVGLALVVDTAPPQIVGVPRNIAGIVTPITIGYILASELMPNPQLYECLSVRRRRRERI